MHGIDKLEGELFQRVIVWGRELYHMVLDRDVVEILWPRSDDEWGVKGKVGEIGAIEFELAFEIRLDLIADELFLERMNFFVYIVIFFVFVLFFLFTLRLLLTRYVFLFNYLFGVDNIYKFVSAFEYQIVVDELW